MPPSPGKIHQLPVKVLYSLDTSPQSYLTILNERQDVYVHPGVAAYNGEEVCGTGSCCLKAAARGICFASPECIPNSASLDFSVYNLDPSLRPNRSARAFQPAADDQSSSSWTGRGFLSWILAESGAGTSLIRGRLIREHEFSSLAFNDQGGLEGLMAAAASRSVEDVDGKGWGLEVCVSLKVVNPEGKAEFAGRKAFEDMLARGTGVGTPSSTANTPTAAVPPPQQQAATISRQNSLIVPPRVSTSAAPSPSLRPSPAIAYPKPSQPPPRPSSDLHRPSSAASLSTSLPASSVPMAVSSSAQSRPSSSAASRESSLAAPQSNPSAPAPSNRSESRHTTPPPSERPRSPPPSTPARATLRQLLDAEGKLSPDVVRHLTENPVLRRLLKAVPQTAVLTSLREAHNATSPTKDRPKASPARTGTPTPSSSHTVKPSVEGCCNCGVTESELWRTKNMKDGTKKKVCNACGLYFNKHKRMRPRELWDNNNHHAGASGTSRSTGDTPRQSDSTAPPPEKRARFEHEPVRSSPRLHRGSSDTNTNINGPPLPHAFESPKKGNNGTMTDSPRKRNRTSKGPIPHPSPRMATRASAKHEIGSTSASGMLNSDFDFSFSPSTLFATSPVQPPHLTTTASSIHASNGLVHEHGATNGNGHGHGIGETVGDADIEALLAQIANGQTTLDIDALFASVTTAATGHGHEGAGPLDKEMMDLLASWEGGDITVSNLPPLSTVSTGTGNGIGNGNEVGNGGVVAKNENQDES
ncbi:hypothetical protein BCR39DRAFT_540955 [Naematelia encephala]|uniref:GATA-type domain-containing protein n=1 Tax=Naematelia encephala TaxID=71784 RepID=A0A1Y2AVC7_9TREE|nr:hypothetical protein BCR39DRAFT_540955 [Naematelia encephala]